MDKPAEDIVVARPRIALLTPYSGNNLGDAAIQDAMIANLRARLPEAQFSGITLNDENFRARHGAGAFPLCGTSRTFHGMVRGKAQGQSREGNSLAGIEARRPRATTGLKAALRRLPILGKILEGLRSFARSLEIEARHSVGGYRFLRAHDLLIVSGGGQLDEEWGGAWGHPFALFKWAVLARMARVPLAMASVGAAKVETPTSRFFLSAALRLSRYRSYRERNTRKIATSLASQAARDPVVPDPAFTLPASALPAPAALRSLAQGRTIVAIGPMAFAKPQSWPTPDGALYDRYLRELAQAATDLLDRGYFLVIVWSALTDRGSAVEDLLGLIGSECMQRFAAQIHLPTIATWKELVSLLLGADFLIATRLHSVILGFVAEKPTLAISFDPKVDWVMEDLGQSDYLLPIRDFKAEDVVAGLERLKAHRGAAEEQIRLYRQENHSVSERQYDVLAELGGGTLPRRD